MRCFYCMPEYGISHCSPLDILSFEEIIRVVKIVSGLGINKIRLTGGELFVREGIINLIEYIARVPGIDDLSFTTNAVLLKKYAGDLKSIGIKRINVSLDTLDNDKFSFITKRDYFYDVVSGIDKAKDAGLFIKLNVVLIRGVNDNEIISFVRFAESKGIIIRFIEFMPMSFNSTLNESGYVSGRDIMNVLSRLGNLTCLDNASADAATYYKIEGLAQPVGFVNAMSEKFCSKCNRLRLSSKGELFPCLGSNIRVDLKRTLRDASSDNKIVELIKKAVYYKPKEHSLIEKGNLSYCPMSKIGG